MNYIENARKFRAAMLSIASNLDDKTASTVPEMFPQLKQNGELIKAGTRINWHGTIKRAAVDLWDTEENNPDVVSNLWETVQYKDGHRLISEVITVAGAFTLDELGWWGDKLMRSKIDANVYTPDQYPAGWEEVAV